MRHGPSLLDVGEVRQQVEALVRPAVVLVVAARAEGNDVVGVDVSHVARVGLAVLEHAGPVVVAADRVRLKALAVALKKTTSSAATKAPRPGTLSTSYKLELIRLRVAYSGYFP